MKINIIAIMALSFFALMLVPEDSEAGRRKGGKRSGKRLKIPHYSVPSIPVIAPKFNNNQEKINNSNNPKNSSNQTTKFSVTKKECLDMKLKLELKNQPENIQFMCSYLGVH